LGFVPTETGFRKGGTIGFPRIGRFLLCVSPTFLPASSGTEESKATEATERLPVIQRLQPDTTAGAVWEPLENFRKNWKLWPGKDECLNGTGPHGARLNTYLNPVAYDARTNKAASMPNGAILVKDNYTSKKELAAVTVMY
jgi:hypothetical protein